MNTGRFIAALLASVVFASVILTPISVSGDASVGEIQVSPAEVSLTEGESQTLEISYDSLSGQNPTGIEFIVEYDPEVISVVDVNDGGYLNGDLSSIGTEPGRVGYGKQNNDNQRADDSGTVATITIELADGVDKGDTTDIRFTSVTAVGVEGTPETIDGTVEAAEGTEEAPQNPVDYDVQIVDPTISKSSVGSSPSDHTLRFDVVNVSSDSNIDEFSVKLPDNVVVENITETTVLKRGTTESVPLEGSDPATDPSPGNKINFAVNPIGSAETQALTVEIDIRLSAAP